LAKAVCFPGGITTVPPSPNERARSAPFSFHRRLLFPKISFASIRGFVEAWGFFLGSSNLSFFLYGVFALYFDDPLLLFVPEDSVPSGCFLFHVGFFSQSFSYGGRSCFFAVLFFLWMFLSTQNACQVSAFPSPLPSCGSGCSLTCLNCSWPNVSFVVSHRLGIFQLQIRNNPVFCFFFVRCCFSFRTFCPALKITPFLPLSDCSPM